MAISLSRSHLTPFDNKLGSAVPSLQLARVFFRDYRDERDAETTENSKVCALKRCRGTKEKVDTRLRCCPCVSVVSASPWKLSPLSSLCCLCVSLNSLISLSANRCPGVQKKSSILPLLTFKPPLSKGGLEGLYMSLPRGTKKEQFPALFFVPRIGLEPTCR